MRPLFVLLLVLLALAPASRAGAAVRFEAPAGLVRAGETIEVRWRNLPVNAREVELELSLDGGRWVRVSPEMSALEGHWSWKVPDLPSGAARLRLRCGREHEEFVAAISGEFSIEGSSLAVERCRSHGGEWWPALESGDGPRAACRCHDEPQLAPLETTTDADLPDSPSLREPPATRTAAVRRTPFVLATPRISNRSARPNFVPLRN